MPEESDGAMMTGVVITATAWATHPDDVPEPVEEQKP